MEEHSGISEKGDYSSEDLDCALNCLIEAEKIQGNPELLKMIKEHAKKRVGEISSVSDLREAAKGNGKKKATLPEALKSDEEKKSLLEKVRNRLNLSVEFS